MRRGMVDLAAAARRPGALEPGLKTLAGILATMRFFGNGFLIGTLDTGVVVKGPIAEPHVGAYYEFEGRVESHPKWGDQFAFSSARARVPTDLGAFAWYLAANAKWIGERRAASIVERYGADALRVCKDEPTKVADEISGISVAQALEISKMLVAVETGEKLSIELRRMLDGSGIGPAIMGRILAKHGKEAPTRIRENPYAMIDDVEGVGFLKADAVALKVGYDRDGPFRVRAAIMHALSDAASGDGHVCVPAGLLTEIVVELIGVEKESIYREMKKLSDDGKIVGIDGYAYLAHLFRDETSAAASIATLLLRTPSQPIAISCEGLEQDQVDALAAAAVAPIFVLTGPPGTGKTFTIRRLVESAGKGVRVELAAPTGKATKRIRESSGMPARTLHRLLETAMVDGKFVFTRDRNRPIDADLIVVDETSMVDATLFARFLEAVRPGARVVFVGDPYQLPSVGPGNVLGSLIASPQVPGVELSTIKRQAVGSLAVLNCHAIKNGKALDLSCDWSKDFVFVERDGLEAIGDEIERLVTEFLPKEFGVDQVTEVQTIVPMRERTSLSTKALNERLRAALNPAPAGDPGRKFRAGDKVIQTRNDYELDVMNGEIGRVLGYAADARTVRIAFDDAEVDVPTSSNDLEFAYALTCHKFQGSEAPVVVVPVCRSFGPLVAQRNWLYTAVSRARRLLVLVGERDEVAAVVARNRPKRRHTRLAKLISGAGTVL